MRITPLEVHNHQFGGSFRGFDRDEVRAFLALVSEEYEQVISENTRLKDQVAELMDGLSQSKGRESRLQKAIESADRIAQEMKDNARRESEVMIKEARLKANKLLDQAQAKASTLEDRINDLKLARDRFHHRLRGILDEHAHALDRTSQETDQEKVFILQRPTSA